MNVQPPWAPEFQRVVIRLGIEGTLPARLPGAFRASLFGSTEGLSGKTTSPRVRIARLVEQYWDAYSSAPGLAVVEEWLRRDQARLGAAENGAIDEEWRAILNVSLPDDPTWVEGEVRKHAERLLFAQGLVKAAELLDSNQPDALTEARAVVERAAAPLLGQGETRTNIRLIADAPERIIQWASGEEGGDQIPTGLEPLDVALGGGPRKGEVHYILAPPKGAKTLVQLTIGMGAVRRRRGVFLASFEMRGVRVLYRIDRSMTRLTKRELREDPSRLESAVRGLKAAGAGEFYVWETIPQLKNAVQQVAREVDKIRTAGGQVDEVIFDYLNIMGSAKQEKEKRHELALISREMAAFVKTEGVVGWSACLVNRAAVNKARIRKTDIAEAFEVVAVADGMYAICGTEEMRAAGFRSLFLVASREEEDEREAGVYQFDGARMLFVPVGQSLGDLEQFMGTDESGDSTDG